MILFWIAHLNPSKIQEHFRIDSHNKIHKNNLNYFKNNPSSNKSLNIQVEKYSKYTDDLKG
jgi:hypothetical protein